MTAVDAPVLGPVARLAPTTLEELVARAALQTRIDRKYVLPLPAAEQFLTELGEQVVEAGTGQHVLAVDPGLQGGALDELLETDRLEVRERRVGHGGHAATSARTTGRMDAGSGTV